MEELKEITMPSGAILKVQLAPFSDAKELYQNLLEEFKNIKIDSQIDVMEAFKSLVCTGLSSKKVDLSLEKCLKRCTYNDGNGEFRIDKDTFEPAKNRVDYTKVCIEVAKENLMPFMKSLYAEYQHILVLVKKIVPK